MGIAIFKEGKKKPTALVDPFGVFAAPTLLESLSEYLKEARERSLDHPSLDFPSQPLSDHMNYHMRRDDRWVHAPDFEHRINEAAKQIKHDAMRLAERKQAQAMIDQYGD